MWMEWIYVVYNVERVGECSDNIHVNLKTESDMYKTLNRGMVYTSHIMTVIVHLGIFHFAYTTVTVLFSVHLKKLFVTVQGKLHTWIKWLLKDV